MQSNQSNIYPLIENRRRSIFFITILTIIVLLFTACKDNKDEPLPRPTETKSAILVYAVASNNLSESLAEDMNEMLIGLTNADLDANDFYIYSIDKNSSDTNPPVLSKAVKDKFGNVSFKIVKKYNRDIFSTDPKRIAEVISDFSSLTPAPHKGLFLWSHATSWFPAFSDHQGAPSPNFITAPKSTSSIESMQKNTEGESDDKFISYNGHIPELQWFGQDTNNGKSDYCDIIELAEAIPDNYFDYIWWDCCYMSSIEVAYQMRNKAKHFVAYPTEVIAEGAPYQCILPFLVKEQPNLTAAAAAMADYFDSGNKCYTIAIIDPSALEDVANYAKSAIVGERKSQIYLLKYSRGGYRFYDFGDYTISWGSSLESDWDVNGFKAAMDRLVVYKSCSPKLLTGQTIPLDQFYGISCHYVELMFDPDWADEDSPDAYYMKLDWYKRVYEEGVRR